MISDKTSETWVAHGQCYSRGTAGTSTLGAIPILEEPRSVSMGEGTRPYGMPIDANLAVHLIQRLLKSIEEEANMLAPDKTHLPFNQKVELLPKNIKDLFDVSYGITFDKNIILKILSQPKCQGMRSYLCESGPEEEGKGHLSLVLVGVDESGNDLHYVDPKGTGTVQRHDNKVDVITQSLTAEYGHPPDTSTFAKKLTDERYALLKLAQEADIG